MLGVEFFEAHGRIAPKFRLKWVKQAKNDGNRVENSEICLYFVQLLAGATVCCSGNFKTDRLLAWRNHPEHQRMQQRGREEFMAEYHIQVCRPERDYSFNIGS